MNGHEWSKAASRWGCNASDVSVPKIETDSGRARSAHFETSTADR